LRWSIILSTTAWSVRKAMIRIWPPHWGQRSGSTSFKKRQDRSAEQLGQSRVVQTGDLMEDAAVIHSALGHQEMEVRVKVDPIPKGLDRGDDARHGILLCHSPEVDGQGVDGTATEVAEEIALILEEDAEHLGDGEDHLTVRDIQEKCLPHPLAPLLKALGMTRWTKSAGAGKPAARVATV